jgi:RimJ/RimL family protein N-acetyltransferase
LRYLETDRLLLRGWHDDDLEPFAAMNADETVMEFYPATLARRQSDALAMRLRRCLDKDGFGLYAVEMKSTRDFIGYVGFAKAEFAAAFTPAVEVGWRLALRSWGTGYASEAARACVSHGFSELGFDELVSFTARRNKRSIAVMERIGMSRSPDDDFEHPKLPVGHKLRPHVLYRIRKTSAGS